ncbi:MAG: hypothetical protein KME64_10385 [Scytonematopsis contorta HA4267-MV1]|nr:hypothetical protein [Scytonematopsis contorta HA4267-MV1]
MGKQFAISRSGTLRERNSQWGVGKQFAKISAFSTLLVYNGMGAVTYLTFA